MTTLDLTGTRLDVEATVGDDVQITFTVRARDGQAVSLADASVSMSVLTPSVVPAAVVVSGPTASTVVCLLTGQQTATLGDGEWPLALSVTRGGIKRQWAHGRLRLVRAGDGSAQGSREHSFGLIVSGSDVVLQLSAAVPGGSEAAMSAAAVAQSAAIRAESAMTSTTSGLAAQAAQIAANTNGVAANTATIASHATAITAVTADAASKLPIAGGVMHGPLFVQPVTGAGEPSRVTAVDNVTGRISINNIECGFTGIRNLAGLLAPDWQGDGSALFVERVGNAVTWYFNLVRASTLGANDPAAAEGILSNVFAAGAGPAGFGAQAIWSFQGSNDHMLHTHGATGDTLVRPVIARVVSNWIQIMVGPYTPDAFPFVRGQITVRAADFWPSTLPGSMVTPSFTLPNF